LSKITRSCGKWQLLARQTFPLCCTSNVDPTANATNRSVYNSFQDLFRQRMAMPHSFPSKVDMLHTITEAARKKQASLHSGQRAYLLLGHRSINLRSHLSIDALLKQAVQVIRGPLKSFGLLLRKLSPKQHIRTC